MDTSPRLAVLLIAGAYLCGILAMVLWIGQAIGLPALGSLDPRFFFRFGWLLVAGLLLAFLVARAVPGEEWIGSQFPWLIRSFVGLLLAGSAGALCLLLGAWLQIEAFAVLAIALWAVGGLWFLYRWARGFRCLLRKQPVGLDR